MHALCAHFSVALFRVHCACSSLYAVFSRYRKTTTNKNMQQFNHGAWINIIYTSHMQIMAHNSNNSIKKRKHQHQPNSSSFLPFGTLNMHDMKHFYGWILQTHTQRPTIIFQHLRVHKTVVTIKQNYGNSDDYSPKEKTVCRLELVFVCICLLLFLFLHRYSNMAGRSYWY